MHRRQWNNEKEQEEIVDHTMRDDELFSLYALVNWCKDSAGNGPQQSDVTKIVREELGYVFQRGFGLYKRLKNSENPLRIAVAAAFDKAPESKRFFTEKGQGWLSKYSNAGVLESTYPNHAPTTTK